MSEEKKLPLLKVNDIHVYYGAIHAIKGISPEVNEGEIVTLIGANGAGKSTTLNTIAGLRKPRHGSIAFAELPVDDAEAFAKWLLTDFRLDGETVMVTPAASFYLDKSLGKRPVRVAYVLEVPKLRRALHILEKALEEYPNKL